MTYTTTAYNANGERIATLPTTYTIAAVAWPGYWGARGLVYRPH